MADAGVFAANLKCRGNERQIGLSLTRCNPGDDWPFDNSVMNIDCNKHNNRLKCRLCNWGEVLAPETYLQRMHCIANVLISYFLIKYQAETMTSFAILSLWNKCGRKKVSEKFERVLWNRKTIHTVLANEWKCGSIECFCVRNRRPCGSDSIQMPCASNGFHGTCSG